MIKILTFPKRYARIFLIVFTINVLVTCIMAYYVKNRDSQGRIKLLAYPGAGIFNLAINDTTVSITDDKGLRQGALEGYDSIVILIEKYKEAEKAGNQLEIQKIETNIQLQEVKNMQAFRHGFAIVFLISMILSIIIYGLWPKKTNV